MAGLVSIIVPALNEEGNIEPLFRRLTELARRIREEFDMATEVVANDNCSVDKTLEELKQQTGTDSLEGAFLKLTGTTIRDESATAADQMRQVSRVWRR